MIILDKWLIRTNLVETRVFCLKKSINAYKIKASEVFVSGNKEDIIGSGVSFVGF